MVIVRAYGIAVNQARDGRTRIAEAVWRTVERDGVAGASVRAVASEAGVTGGTVQYHFSTHARMLHFAMELLADRFTQRLVETPRTGEVADWTRAILLEMLPLSEDRQREFRVWLAFTTHAHTDPQLAALKESFAERLRELYQRLCDARRAAGLAGDDPLPVVDLADDPGVAILQAVIDGLALQLAELSPAEASVRGPRLLDHYLSAR
nr:TetR family transcriptional regulator C-terminal domain-containing protein [Ornithinimicrobium sp. HY1793]